MNIFSLLSFVVRLLPRRAKKWLENQVFMEKSTKLPEDSKLNHPALGIAFGGDDSRVKAALDLYQKGTIDVIMVTGGVGKFSNSTVKETGTPEAILWRDYLSENGVPTSKIWVESNSKTTLENTAFCARELCLLGPRWSSIILITSSYHMQRTVGLMYRALRRYHFDFGRELYWFGIDGKYSRDNWLETTKGRALILKEYLRLVQYRRTGKI